MPPKQVKTKDNPFVGFVEYVGEKLEKSVKQEDLMMVVKTLIDAIKEVEDRISKNLATDKESTNSSVLKLEQTLFKAREEIDRIISQSKEENTENVNKVIKQLREEINTVRNEIPEIPELPKEKDYSEIFEIFDKKLTKLEQLTLGENVRNSLEALNGEDRLAMEAIRGLIEELQRIEKSVKTSKGMPAPSRGLYFYIDGLKKGLLNTMNFKPGTNMAIAYSEVNGQPTITFNATGGGPGGISVETPTGTVNAVNATFTPSAEPQWVVADGITYYDGAGYTWSSPNIVMDVPPSASIRAII